MPSLRPCRPLLAALSLLLALVMAAPPSTSASSLTAARSQTGDWELVETSEPAVRLYAPASGALFARTATGLRRTDDGGTTWRSIELPPRKDFQQRIVVEVDPTDHTRMFANGANGVYRSADDGATWTLLPLPPGTGSSVRSIAMSPADRSLMYVSMVSDESTGTTMWLLRSPDGGDSWELVKESNSGPSCGYSVDLFWPHPTEADRVYRRAGCGRGEPNGAPMEHSADRGASWINVTARPIGNPVKLVGGRGESTGRFYLATHLPTEDSPQGVFRSEDGLSGWSLVLTIPGISVGALAYDPAQPDHVFAGTSAGQVLASIDGGLSWTPLGRGDLGAVRDLVLGIDGNNLYAATEQGVWRYSLSPERL